MGFNKQTRICKLQKLEKAVFDLSTRASELEKEIYLLKNQEAQQIKKRDSIMKTADQVASILVDRYNLDMQPNFLVNDLVILLSKWESDIRKKQCNCKDKCAEPIHSYPNSNLTDWP